MTSFTGPDAPFHAEVAVPGDKSLSHRALVLAAMASGRSAVRGLGTGADVRATERCLDLLGIEMGEGSIVSAGFAAWRQPAQPLDAGNSGTTIRLLTGALSARPFRTTLIGDASLMVRPMRRLVAPLGALGARVAVSDAGTPPVVVDGRPLRGGAVAIPVPSAQVRTAVALAALQAEGPTTIDSPPGFRDHTERWLAHLGLGSPLADTSFRIDPGPVPAFDMKLPADPSSAAFVWASAAITPGASVRVRSVSLNPGRTGFLGVIRDMGATVDIIPTGHVLGDPIGDVTVTGAELRGTVIAGETTTRTIDELPLLAVAAAFAEGPTTVSDASELRTKESDRIATTLDMIRALGGEAEPHDSGFVVAGGRLTGGTVAAAGDHRVAMAAAVAATRGTTVTIAGFEAAAVSWPGFERALEDAWSSR